MTGKGLMALGLLAFAGWSLAGCGMIQQAMRPSPEVWNPEFSPDGEQIYVSHCNRQRTCAIAVHDLRTGEWRHYEKPRRQKWQSPALSPDGTKIAFDLMETKSSWARLAIMNIDGSDLRMLTDDGVYSAAPSFSPDGRRLVYVQAPDATRYHPAGVSNWDIFELELATDETSRMTESRFYGISRPHYYAGGETVIFSGVGPKSPDFPSLDLNYSYFFQSHTKALNPSPNIAVFDGIGRLGSRPYVIGHSGNFVFRAASEFLERDIKGASSSEVFLYRNGEFERLTFLERDILDLAASWDGKRVAFTWQQAFGKPYKLYVMNIDGSDITEISVPKKFAGE